MNAHILRASNPVLFVEILITVKEPFLITEVAYSTDD